VHISAVERSGSAICAKASGSASSWNAVIKVRLRGQSAASLAYKWLSLRMKEPDTRLPALLWIGRHLQQWTIRQPHRRFRPNIIAATPSGSPTRQ
jgi:hypothetical protein